MHEIVPLAPNVTPTAAEAAVAVPAIRLADIAKLAIDRPRVPFDLVVEKCRNARAAARNPAFMAVQSNKMTDSADLLAKSCQKPKSFIAFMGGSARYSNAPSRGLLSILKLEYVN